MTFKPCSVCGAGVGEAYRGPIRAGAFPNTIPAAISRCERCGTERLEDIQLPADYYSSDSYRMDLQEEPDVAGYFKRHDWEQYGRLGLLESIQLRDAIVVDVGCAGGSFLDSVAGFAKTTIGIDPATAYRDSLRERGHRVYGSTEEAVRDWRGRVNVATSFSVIEHVDDPVGLLRGIRDLLAPDGIAIVSTPNLRDVLISAVGDAYRSFFYRKVHTFYFDGPALRAAADAAGFGRVRIRHVHRFGHANFATWLRDKKPGGRSESMLGDAFDQTWRTTLEQQGLADYLYAYLQQ